MIEDEELALIALIQHLSRGLSIRLSDARVVGMSGRVARAVDLEALEPLIDDNAASRGVVRRMHRCREAQHRQQRDEKEKLFQFGTIVMTTASIA